MDGIEWIVLIGIYAVLLGVTLFAAAVPAILIGAWRQKPFPRKIFFLTLCLMAAYAAWIEGRPWIVCPDNLEKPVTQEQREKLRDYWGGFYSQRIPILAHYIVVRENGEDGLEATVFYLWFGSIGVSFDSEGLPSITKPLSGL